MPSVPLPPKESNLFKRILVSPRPRSSLSSFRRRFSLLCPLARRPCSVPSDPRRGLLRTLPELALAERKRMRRPRSPRGELALPPPPRPGSSPFPSFVWGPPSRPGEPPSLVWGAAKGWCRPRPGEGGKEGGSQPATRCSSGGCRAPSPPAAVTPRRAPALGSAPSSPSLPPQAGAAPPAEAGRCLRPEWPCGWLETATWRGGAVIPPCLPYSGGSGSGVDVLLTAVACCLCHRAREGGGRPRSTVQV